ncbi:hypothetical protein PAA8504_03936 [Palleronia abyssalis]|uniref:Uncharacterized protein n=1 Tax=Palleronia abyssalis TaxID=1501240 RepID=A0A2R8C101_9RHOB|nr:hypothetical protein PAA8504_03936 [Palleronia abyssalis]
MPTNDKSGEQSASTFNSKRTWRTKVESAFAAIYGTKRDYHQIIIVTNHLEFKGKSADI